jgi:hypothetical protein
MSHPHPELPDAVEVEQLERELQTGYEEIARYILHNSDFEREDRLWPPHYYVFATNPLNVAFGACGTALFLHRTLGHLPPRVLRWLEERPLAVTTHPPGLFMGLAGIAYSFWELGLHDRAREAMLLTYQSHLLYEDPSMFLGMAGWGFVSLWFHERTGDRIHLDMALDAGRRLVESARLEGETRYWRFSEDKPLHYGFGYGASGIALFLLHLYLRSGEDDFRRTAVQGIEFDLANRVEGKMGWQWQRYRDDTLQYPYWIQGSAGIGATVIRFHHLLGIERYARLAHRIAQDGFIKYSFTPGLFDGLAGIGELMLDMYRFTGDPLYRRQAFDIADTISWFKIEKATGHAYPGPWLSRISTDYATGSAGIGLFFDRLLRPGARLFMDLERSQE